MRWLRGLVALGVTVIVLGMAGSAWASSDSLTLSVAPGATDMPGGLSTTA